MKRPKRGERRAGTARNLTIGIVATVFFVVTVLFVITVAFYRATTVGDN